MLNAKLSFVCLCFALASTASNSHAQCTPYPSAVQWRIEDGGNGHYYARVDDGVLWPAAKAAAEALGGHLATITSQPENAHIAVIATDGNVNVKHLGGIRDGDTWRWITGEPWSYINWYPGEPNNLNGIEIYLATWVIPGTWNDIYPAYAAGYIVEWEPLMADCDGNGICDFVQIAQQPNLDVNGDATLDQCQCIADVVADGVVDAVDLARVLNDWGSPNSSGDIDRNGIVDASDLAYVLSTWGPCHP